MATTCEDGSQNLLGFVNLALEQAKIAMQNLEVPAGCVIVNNGKVISSGRNRTTETRNATRHAEMEATDILLESWQKYELIENEVAEQLSKLGFVSHLRTLYYVCSGFVHSWN